MPFLVLDHVLFISLVIEDLACRLLQSILFSAIHPPRLVVWNSQWFPGGCKTILNLRSVTSNIRFSVLNVLGSTMLVLLLTVNCLVILLVVVLLSLLLVLMVVDRRQFKLLLINSMGRWLARMIIGFFYWWIYCLLRSGILWCSAATVFYLVAYTVSSERNSVTLGEQFFHFDSIW